MPAQSRKRKTEDDTGPTLKYRRTQERNENERYMLTTKKGAVEVRSINDIEKQFKSDRSADGLQNVNEYVDIMRDLVVAISNGKLSPNVAAVDDVVTVGLAAVISAKRHLGHKHEKDIARKLATHLVSAAATEPVLSRALKRALETRSFPKFSELGITDRMKKQWAGQTGNKSDDKRA